MSDRRNAIWLRGIKYSTNGADYPTALLREEIQHAKTIHEEALKHADLSSYFEDLDAVHNRLREHWTKVYGDLDRRALLLQDMVMYEQSLIPMLLGHYANVPYEISKWANGRAQWIVLQESHTKTDTGGSEEADYSTRHVWPLEEMMLNREHVEHKLRTAVAKKEHESSEVQLLVDLCDWTNLAMLLTNDHDLLFQLIKARRSDAQFYDTDTYSKILHGINIVKKKYFAEHLDPLTFTLSKYAEKLSAGKGLGLNSTMPGSLPSSSLISRSSHAEIATSNHSLTRNVFSAITSSLEGISLGIKSRGHRSHMEVDKDEVSSLLNSKKAE